MASRFSGNEFAVAKHVAPCFGSANTAIAAIAIAVPTAAPKPGASNGAPPIAAIREARKASSIIVIASGNTGAGERA